MLTIKKLFSNQRKGSLKVVREQPRSTMKIVGEGNGYYIKQTISWFLKAGSEPNTLYIYVLNKHLKDYYSITGVDNQRVLLFDS